MWYSGNIQRIEGYLTNFLKGSVLHGAFYNWRGHDRAGDRLCKELHQEE